MNIDEKLENLFKELSETKEAMISDYLAMSELPKLFPDDDYWFNFLMTTATKLSNLDFLKMLETMKKGETISSEERTRIENLRDDCIVCYDFLERRAKRLDEYIDFIDEGRVPEAKAPSLH